MLVLFAGPRHVRELSIQARCFAPRCWFGGGLENRLVDVSLPKFRFNTQLKVKPALEALGMTEAFHRHRRFPLGNA